MNGTDIRCRCRFVIAESEGELDVRRVIAPIPTTSPTRYLTGKTALNIPSPEGTGDWHFSETFASPPRHSIAGENRISTKAFLGDEGIFDCAPILRRCGAVDGATSRVFAANHYRAVADLVLDLVIRRKAKVAGVVVLDDWFPQNDEKRRVVELLEKARPKLPAEHWEKISTWLTTQQN
ncbi:MAG: hypothetical protein LBV28_01635 [Puniceicoccales bacterium]|jgi:hypothetical protein|nr:hypothetical protein [Puniceicoccales bacterium]